MLNLILCECKKFKRRQIFILATLAAFIFPIIITALFWNTPDPDFENLFAGIVDYGDFLLLLPILVIVASSMFFTEQDNGTLKNIEMVPVSRNQIVISKLSVMLILAVVYTVGGYLASAVCAKILGMILTGFLTKLILSIALGIMTYIAALPCILLVVWFNKNDIISVVITLFYTILNYVVHYTDAGMLVPTGFNIGTILPIPLIYRWIYSFFSPGQGASLEFYQKMEPYFVATPICIGILLVIGAVTVIVIFKGYKRREG